MVTKFMILEINNMPVYLGGLKFLLNVSFNQAGFAIGRF